MGTRNKCIPILFSTDASRIILLNVESQETIYSRDFKNEYSSHWLTEYFDTCVSHTINNSNSFLIYAPYLVMVQSSGTGKTRLLLESSKKMVVMYTLCQRVHSVKPSPIFQNMFEKIKADLTAKFGNCTLDLPDDHEDLETFGLYCANVYISYLFASLKWIIKKVQSTGVSFFDASKEFTMLLFEQPEEFSVFLDSYRHQFNNVIKLKTKERMAFLKKEYNTLISSCGKSKASLEDLKFIVAFDEAGYIIQESKGGPEFSLFLRILRRGSLDPFFEHIKFAIIFTGTNSKLTNFLPVLKKAGSAETRGNVAIQNKPFIMPFLEANSKYESALFFDLELLRREFSLRSFDFFLFGRWLWKDTGSNRLKVIQSAYVKLCGGDNLTQSYSAVMSRIPFSVSPPSSSVELLVKDNMAILLNVNSELSMYTAEYVFEPSLSIAASIFFKVNSRSCISFVKNFISGSVLDGTVGPKGEIVTMLYLLDIMDCYLNFNLITHTNWNFSVSAETFLSKIFGYKICFPGLVGFIRFVQFKCSYNKEIAIRCLSLMIAFKGGINNKGFDFAIPVLTPTGVSTIFIEVKNHFNEVKEEDIWKKYNNVETQYENEFPDFLFIFFDLRQGCKIPSNSSFVKVMNPKFYWVDFSAVTKEPTLCEDYRDLLPGAKVSIPNPKYYSKFFKDLESTNRFQLINGCSLSNEAVDEYKFKDESFQF